MVLFCFLLLGGKKFKKRGKKFKKRWQEVTHSGGEIFFKEFLLPVLFLLDCSSATFDGAG